MFKSPMVALVILTENGGVGIPICFFLRDLLGVEKYVFVSIIIENIANIKFESNR